VEVGAGGVLTWRADASVLRSRTVSVWVFGYGSLIWRPGFAFDERHPAFVDGYARRLHQGSPDHRGTPEHLGRVATLERAPGERCFGAAYRIAEGAASAVLPALDVREQGGYERLELTATLATTPPREVSAVTWIASRDNPYHLGPAPLVEMVSQIRTAVGPSGSNLEYVLELHRALGALGHEDPHVTALVEAMGAVA
jgi:cation transport regulator ChaC